MVGTRLNSRATSILRTLRSTLQHFLNDDDTTTIHAPNLEDRFIPSGVNIIATHPDILTFAKAKKSSLQRRWHSAKGKQILEALTESNFDRQVMNHVLGQFYSKLDLRGAPLAKRSLRNLDLTSIDFFASDLRGADFWGSNLDDSHLSEADIRAAVFDFASMNNTFLDRTRYDRKTSFIGVDTRKVNFNLAVLLQDQARNQQRVDHLRSRHRIFSFLLWITCDYGRSFPRFLFWVIFIILSFASIYYHYPVAKGIDTCIDAIYFSIITFSTLGFGDIVPDNNVGKIIVATEVALGYAMGGLLVAILVRRTIGS